MLSSARLLSLQPCGAARCTSRRTTRCARRRPRCWTSARRCGARTHSTRTRTWPAPRLCAAHPHLQCLAHAPKLMSQYGFAGLDLLLIRLSADTFNEDSHLAGSTFVRRTPTVALPGPRLHLLAHTLKLMMQSGLKVLIPLLTRQSANLYITAWPVHSLPCCASCLEAHLLCCRLCKVLRLKRGYFPCHLCVASCALGIAFSGPTLNLMGGGACLQCQPCREEILIVFVGTAHSPNEKCLLK